MSLRRPDRLAAAQLDKVYAEDIPAIECKGLCAASCGPIAMSRVEWERIRDRIGREPKADPGALRCPLLNAADRCSVYDIRPAICRLWGVVDALACPHGCTPDRGKHLTRVEGYDILTKINKIGT